MRLASRPTAAQLQEVLRFARQLHRDPALRSQRVGTRSLFGVAAVARRAGSALTPHALRLLWSGLVLLLVLASCLSEWF